MLCVALNACIPCRRTVWVGHPPLILERNEYICILCVQTFRGHAFEGLSPLEPKQGKSYSQMEKKKKKTREKKTK